MFAAYCSCMLCFSDIVLLWINRSCSVIFAVHFKYEIWNIQRATVTAPPCPALLLFMFCTEYDDKPGSMHREDIKAGRAALMSRMHHICRYFCAKKINNKNAQLISHRCSTVVWYTFPHLPFSAQQPRAQRPNKSDSRGK